MLVATAFGRTVVDAEVAVGNLLRQFFAKFQRARAGVVDAHAEQDRRGDLASQRDGI